MVKQFPDGAPKYGLRPAEVAYAFGSQKLFHECLEAAWLKPVVQRHKLTLFDRDEVALCWARILRGEKPLR